MVSIVYLIAIYNNIRNCILIEVLFVSRTFRAFNFDASKSLPTTLIIASKPFPLPRPSVRTIRTTFDDLLRLFQVTR